MHELVWIKLNESKCTVKQWDSASCCYLLGIRHRGKIRGNTVLVPGNLRPCKMTIHTSIVAIFLNFLCCTFYSELPYMGAELYCTNIRQKVCSYKIYNIVVLWITHITLCVFMWVTIFRRNKQSHYSGYHSPNIHRRQRLIFHAVTKIIW